MLRTLRSPHATLRLHGFQITTTAVPGISVGVGAQELSAYSRAAAGKASFTLAEALYGAGTIITPGANIASGAFACYDTAFSSNVMKAECLSAAGVGDDGTMHIIACGPEANSWVSDRADPKQAVKGVCSHPRMLPFKVASAGTIAIGKSQASCALASSVYTLTPSRAFGRAPVVLASPIAAAAKGIRVTSAAAGAVAIETYDPVGGALENNSFYALILGWDTPDIMAGLRRAIKVPQVAPRVEFFLLDGTAATAHLDGATCDATVTDNGVGDFTLTFAEPFAREPIVLVTGKDYRAQNLAAATTTTCQVGSFGLSGGGHAAIDDFLQIAVIGFDNDTDI